MKSTLTKEQQQAIVCVLARMPDLAVGLGTKERACSLAAINLALTGKLTDAVPACMSLVVGKWIIPIQDKMPAELRNSPEWRQLLPLAAGTGGEKEKERLQLILEWMWGCLAEIQSIADMRGFGPVWAQMICDRTAASADATVYATSATSAAYAYADAYAAYADAYAAATSAAYAATAAAYAAAADAAASAAAATSAAYAATSAAAADAAADAAVDFWSKHSPIQLLEKLIQC